MITEKEFKERFSFEPKQDDLHRVNCDQAGKAGHLMCGICKHCEQPRFVCGDRCEGAVVSDLGWRVEFFADQEKARLRQLGLEQVGDQLFALPDEEGHCPVILVFKPEDIPLGINVDPNTVFIVRERALSESAYRVIIEESGVGDMLYRPINDETIHEIQARINSCVMAAVHKGDLFKDLGSIWRHSKENC